MALSADMEWDVRSDGSDTNGGAFKRGASGTDGSQSASPIHSYTDLVLIAGDLTMSSVARPFQASDVGNILHITGGTGFTTGKFEIISVAAGIATVDRDAGTAAGSSGGTGKLGGAMLTPGAAEGSAIASNIIWIKGGATYTFTTTSAGVANGRLSPSAGSAAKPTVIRGYNSTHGDHPTDSQRPILQWGVNASSNPLIDLDDDIYIEYLVLDANRGSYTNTQCLELSAGSSDCVVRRCKLMGANAGLVVGSSNCNFYDCEFTDWVTVTGFNTGSARHMFEGCYFHDAAFDAITVSTGSIHLVDCIFDTIKSTTSYSGVVMTGAGFLFASGCTVYNSGSHGFDLQAAGGANIRNSIFDTNGGYGINVGAAAGEVFIVNCAGRNNTSGDYTTANVRAQNVVNFKTPTGDPFTDAAGGNFALDATANEGALLRAAAAPAGFSTTTTNYKDIGAAQHQDAGGGGTVVIGPPNKRGNKQ